MATKTRTATKSPREELIALLTANPELEELVRAAYSQEPADDGEAVELPDIFDGALLREKDKNGEPKAPGQPTESKSGQSVKWTMVGYAKDSAGKSHKALVIAYLPPEVAPIDEVEDIIFGLTITK